MISDKNPARVQKIKSYFVHATTVPESKQSLV